MNRFISLARTYRWLLACLTTLFVLSIVPLVQYPSSGSSFEGFAYARYMDYYYTSMAREVYDGHPLMGNPFFFEHRDSIAPAMIMPFIIYALPLFAGLSLAATSILNLIISSIIFGLALYLIFRRLLLPEWWAALGTVIVYVLMYGQLIRPVSMGMVHPALLLFVLTFFYWWEKSTTVRTAILSAVIAFCIYDYPYLLHIIVWFLLFVFGQLLYARDWVRVRHALTVGGITTVFCIPFLIITWIQIHDQYYTESLLRIGLGYTHVPSLESFRGATRIFSLLVLAFISYRWIFVSKKIENASFVFHYLVLGAAILVLSFENVITGLDLETASHAERFVMIWFAIGTVIASYYVYSARNIIAGLSLGKMLVVGGLTLFILYLNMPYVRDADVGLRGREAIRTMAQDVSAASPTLQWIDAHEKEPQVIWTNPKNNLVQYISELTRQYPFFGNGLLQLVPTSEVEERYLVAHSVGSTTLESITEGVWDFDGVGAARDTPNTINRTVKACRVLQLAALGYECGELTNARTLYAAHYADMYQTFTTEIKPHLADELKKFHVTYVIRDNQTDADFHPELVVKMQMVYSDQRFEIYKIEEI